jgi:cytochrome b561
MALRNTSIEWGSLAKALHWLIAVGIVVLVALGLAQAGLAWQKLTAAVVHWGLYIIVFVQLISGAMAVATKGNGLPFFGILRIPLPVGEDDDAHHFWEEIHEFAWRVIAVLLAAHVVGALYNHFVLKNDVLRRMTSGVKVAND